MPSPLAAALQFVRTNDLKTIIAKFNERETHPVIQFIKYGVCGALATVIFSIVYLVMTHFFPGDPHAETWEKFRETLLPTAVAFCFANAVVYWLNTRWVFVQGRHSPLMEFLWFTMVNMPGAVGGALVQGLLVSHYGWTKPAALFGFLVPNILINYVCRKFFIFKQ
jgi:putative flippase GtrA